MVQEYINNQKSIEGNMKSDKEFVQLKLL
jgi:hypothetical protein